MTEKRQLLSVSRRKPSKASLFQIIIFCASVLVVESLPATTTLKLTSLKFEEETSRQQSKAGKESRGAKNGVFAQWNPEEIFGSRSRRNRRSVLNRLRSISQTHTFCLIGNLLSKHGFFLGIFPNGTVKGIADNKSPFVKLQLQTHNTSVRRIKGVLSDLYLAVNKKGDVVTEKNATNDSFWIEHHEENHYLTYRSLKMSQKSPNGNWYLAIKSHGGVKRGKNAKPGMNAAQFQFMRTSVCSKK